VLAISELEPFLARSARAHLKIHELEQEPERRGREAVRRALQAHLDERGRACPGAAAVMKADGREVRLTHLAHAHEAPHLHLRKAVGRPLGLRGKGRAS
jgi:hypothetical protein